MLSLQVNKRKLRNYLIIGVVCYLLFLIINLPASIFVRYVLGQITATKNLRVMQPRGSMWAGESIDAYYGRMHLGKVAWKLSSLGLFVGNADINLKLSGQNTQANGAVALGFGGKISVDNLEARLPASELNSLFGGMPINLSGNILGNINDLDIKPGAMFRGKGRVVWQQATLVAPHQIELGDILVEIEPQNNINTHITITDQGEKGQLKINVTLDILATGKYRWGGSLKPRQTDEEKLNQLLNFIGRADSGGNYWLSQSGQFTGW